MLFLPKCDTYTVYTCLELKEKVMKLKIDDIR